MGLAGQGDPRSGIAKRRALVTPCRATTSRDWYLIAKQPAPAPRLAHSEGRAALRIVLVTVFHVSRSCEHFPDGFDLCLLRCALVAPCHVTASTYRGTSLVRNRPTPLGLPHAPRHGPTVGSYEVAISHKRGNILGVWYRGTSLIRNRIPLGPYFRPMPRDLW